MAINEELLKILVCPQCKGDLEYVGDGLICHSCKLKFKVEDEIPIMLIDEAVKLG